MFFLEIRTKNLIAKVPYNSLQWLQRYERTAQVQLYLQEAGQFALPAMALVELALAAGNFLLTKPNFLVADSVFAHSQSLFQTCSSSILDVACTLSSGAVIISDSACSAALMQCSIAVQQDKVTFTILCCSKEPSLYIMKWITPPTRQAVIYVDASNFTNLYL